MSSSPTRVACAALQDVPPSMGRVARFTARWSCSTRLCRSFTWRMMLGGPSASWSRLRAASWASRPSLVLVSGLPCRRLAGVSKRRAASRSRCPVRRQSLVCPDFSTARYQERHVPFTVREVSSMRLRRPTGRLRRGQVSSRPGLDFRTQRWRVACSTGPPRSSMRASTCR
jgi:hypothetical protein